MNNNSIVEEVCKSYQIKLLIKVLINDSDRDESINDLEQYIYLYLLEMDNDKLNFYYKNDKLRNYISSLIKNQRNLTKYSEYNKNRLWEHQIINENYTDDPDDTDDRLEFVYSYLDRMESLWTLSGITEELKNIALSFSIYKYYIINNISQRELFKRIWWIDKTKILRMIKFTKNKILEEYDNFIHNDTL